MRVKLHIKFPSLARHFNMRPGSCFKGLGISPSMFKTRQAPLSPQNCFLFPVTTCLLILQVRKPCNHFLLTASSFCSTPVLSHLPQLTPLLALLLDYCTKVNLFVPFFNYSLHCYQVNLLDTVAFFISKSYTPPFLQNTNSGFKRPQIL